MGAILSKLWNNNNNNNGHSGSANNGNQSSKQQDKSAGRRTSTADTTGHQHQSSSGYGQLKISSIPSQLPTSQQPTPPPRQQAPSAASVITHQPMDHQLKTSSESPSCCPMPPPRSYCPLSSGRLPTGKQKSWFRKSVGKSTLRWTLNVINTWSTAGIWFMNVDLASYQVATDHFPL